MRSVSLKEMVLDKYKYNKIYGRANIDKVIDRNICNVIKPNKIIIWFAIGILTIALFGVLPLLARFIYLGDVINGVPKLHVQMVIISIVTIICTMVISGVVLICEYIKKVRRYCNIKYHKYNLYICNLIDVVVKKKKTGNIVSGRITNGIEMSSEFINVGSIVNKKLFIGKDDYDLENELENSTIILLQEFNECNADEFVPLVVIRQCNIKQSNGVDKVDCEDRVDKNII